MSSLTDVLEKLEIYPWLQNRKRFVEETTSELVGCKLSFISPRNNEVVGDNNEFLEEINS